MKDKILFSGLGGSLFPYLHNKLEKDFNLYYVDADETLKDVYSSLNYFTSPLVTDDSYLPFIKDIINEIEIDYYIPLIDEELLLAKEKVEGYNDVIVISPSTEFISLCLDKYKLMKRLKDQNISNIETYLGSEFDWQIESPIFVKPNTGRGSRGVYKINTKDQLQAYYKLKKYEPKEVIVQPYIEGKEYTVGVTTNNLNNIISIGTKKVIKKEGITKLAIIEDLSIIDKISKKIVDKFIPSGPFNIQLKVTPDDEVKIFEINPRFSTTSIMEYEGGIDLISLYKDNYNMPYNGSIKKPRKNLMLQRRWENLFYYAE